MLDLWKGLKKGVVIYSVAAIVIGIILIVYPQITSQVICYSLAGVIFVSGIMDFIRYFSNDFSHQYIYDLMTGFLLCAVGTFMILRSDIVIKMIPFIVGIFMIVEGIINMARALQLRHWGLKQWLYDFLLSLLLFVLGLIIIFDPFDVAMISIMFIGVCFIYDGLLNLLLLHRTNQLTKTRK